MILVFDLCSRSSLYWHEQGERRAIETGRWQIMQKRLNASSKGFVDVLTPLLPCRFPFALCLGHSAQLRFAHRFAIPREAPLSDDFERFAALGRERSASGHLLFL